LSSTIKFPRLHKFPNLSLTLAEFPGFQKNGNPVCINRSENTFSKTGTASDRDNTAIETAIVSTGKKLEAACGIALQPLRGLRNVVSCAIADIDLTALLTSKFGCFRELACLFGVKIKAGHWTLRAVPSQIVY